MSVKTVSIPDHIKQAISDNLRKGRRDRIADELRQRCARGWFFKPVSCVEAKREELCVLCQAAEELES